MTELRDAALTYAARGWYVFPCHTPPPASGCSCRQACGRIGKHPRTQHGLKDATQARVGCFEGLRGLVSRRCDACQRLARGTILVAARCGCALPLMSTVCDLRKLTHGTGLHLAPWQVATGEVVG